MPRCSASPQQPQQRQNSSCCYAAPAEHKRVLSATSRDVAHGTRHTQLYYQLYPTPCSSCSRAAPHTQLHPTPATVELLRQSCSSCSRALPNTQLHPQQLQPSWAKTHPDVQSHSCTMPHAAATAELHHTQLQPSCTEPSYSPSVPGTPSYTLQPATGRAVPNTYLQRSCTEDPATALSVREPLTKLLRAPSEMRALGPRSNPATRTTPHFFRPRPCSALALDKLVRDFDPLAA